MRMTDIRRYDGGQDGGGCCAESSTGSGTPSQLLPEESIRARQFANGRERVLQYTSATQLMHRQGWKIDSQARSVEWGGSCITTRAARDTPATASSCRALKRSVVANRGGDEEEGVLIGGQARLALLVPHRSSCPGLRLRNPHVSSTDVSRGWSRVPRKEEESWQKEDDGTR